MEAQSNLFKYPCKSNDYTIIIHWRLQCLVKHHCSRRDLWWGLEFICTD